MTACWDLINTEWDPDQETVNFGTRQFVQDGSALYDVVTLATVECSNPGISKSEPKVIGNLWEQYTVLAVDNYCHILADNCETSLKSFSLDSGLSCKTWSSDGQFLFLVTTGGYLTTLFIPDRFLITSMPLPNFSAPNHPVSIYAGMDEIMILSSSGVLLRLSNFNLTALASALSNKDMPQALEIQGNIKRNVVECLLKTTITAATTIEDQNGNILYVIGTVHGIFLWDFNRNIIITGAPLSCTLKQIQATECNKFIVTLDNEGSVVCYDRSFLLPVYQLEGNGQFALLEMDETMKRILTTNFGEIGNGSIIMRSFMGHEAEYRVQVSDFCFLLPSSTKQNDIVFIEGARDEDGNVTTLRIRKMTEGRPIDRLRRLIARGKFEEGLKFAENFNLDSQIVYTAKATRLSQDLQKWSNTKPELHEGKYKDFIETLDFIKDIRFVVECCLKFAPSSIDFIRDSLAYARKRLNLSKNKDDESDRLHYLMQVCNVQEKLATFELIYGPSVTDYWYSIDMEDMFKNLIEILNNEEMTSALILWQRHHLEIVKDPAFAEEETLQLLGSIPADLKSSILMPWLQLVLPTLVQFDRDRIPLVVDWIIRKAASFEFAERQEWPRNALKFTETLSNSLKVVCSFPSEPIAPLFESIDVLNEMVVLYENYKIPITHSKFTQENKLATINLLLNWLPSAGDVGPFLDVFLLPFMRRRSMDIDESIFHYILNLLHNSVSWWHSGQAQWEHIVSTLITYIKSIEVQAKSILAALCQAPVPWSSTVTHLAEKGKKLEHPLAQKIKEEHQIVPLKTVLRHYNIHVFDLSDPLLMDCIIRNILKQQTEECLDHALVVARMSNSIDENHVRTTFITILLCNSNYTLIADILKKLSKEESAACCNKLLYFVEGSLNTFVKKPKPVYEQRVNSCMGGLHVIIECYQASTASAAHGSFLNRVSDFRNIYRLLAYGVRMISSDYCHLSKRQDCLKKFCVNQLEQGVVDYTRLSRVAHLLSLSESFGLKQQLLAAQRMEKNEVMVDCAERLRQCPENEAMAEACFVASQCLNVSKRATDTIELQSQLAAKAATYCSSSHLTDSSELCRLVNLRHLIYKRSSQMGSSPDVYNSISSLGVYQDFTTPILNRDIMKFLSNAQSRVLPFIESSRSINSIVGLSSRIPLIEAADALREFTDECLSVVQVLRGCRQLMLALDVAYASDSLIQLLFSGLPNLDSVAIYNKTIAKHFDELSSQLLIRVMTANRPEVPDMALATSCLLLLGPADGYKYLVDLVKRSTSDRRRVFYVGFLGRLLFKLSKRGGEEEIFFDSVLTRCHWSMKLAPYGIHVQIPPTDEMLPILDTLVSLEDLPLELLSSFCSTFPVDLNHALLVRSQFLITSTEGSNMLKRMPRILEVLAQLSPTDVLKTIANVRNKINPYNYELLTCLLNILLQLQPDKLEVKAMVNLLEFLSCYERCTPPTMMETQSAFYRLPGSEEWPFKRLPLYYQIDANLAKSIYHEEFHVSNWSVWYDSPSLLPINRDEICMLAVTNTIKRYNKEYQDQSQIEVLFQKIKMCLDSISSVSLAAACAADITQRLSTNPEHFFAADLHMQLCEKWKTEDPTAGTAAYNKSVKVYQKVQTEESLNYFDLWNKRYEALTPYPERLIRSLFEDSDRFPISRYEAINSAAENICQIFGLNLKVLKHAMVLEWLPPIEQFQQEDFYPQHGFDSSDGSSLDSNIEAQNKQNLQRIICILKGSDYNSWVEILRVKALDDEERPAVRVRALTALREALSESQMIEYMDLHSFTLDIRIKVLTFLSRLEFVGLVYKEEEFEAADKADLIRGLLQSGGGTQRCITLAMDLATYNIIQDNDIWVSILEKIIKFQMLETAQQLLKVISEIRTLWVNPVMAPIWNLILQTPFKKNTSDVNHCVSTLQMLWSCPFLEDLDMDTLETYVFSHDFPYLAALLLPFVKCGKRSDLIQKLQTFGSNENLERSLDAKCPNYPYLCRVKILLQS